MSYLKPFKWMLVSQLSFFPYSQKSFNITCACIPSRDTLSISWFDHKLKKQAVCKPNTIHTFPVTTQSLTSTPKLWGQLNTTTLFFLFFPFFLAIWWWKIYYWNSGSLGKKCIAKLSKLKWNADCLAARSSFLPSFPSPWQCTMNVSRLKAFN